MADETPAPFKFDIDSVFEIAGDPEGHYHHYSVLAGHLRSGTLTVGGRIRIPTRYGPFAARIIGLETTRGMLAESLSAESFKDQFGICTEAPAVEKAIVVPGPAMNIDDAGCATLNRRMLADHPDVFLHHVARDGGRYPRLCGWCAEPLLESPELISAVATLAARDDSSLASLAAELLRRREEPPRG